MALIPSHPSSRAPRKVERSSAFSRVTALAERRTLHEAFRWLHLHGQQMMRWQAELVVIPGPPFGEADRSVWMAERFREAGLAVETDEVGNVFGVLAAEPRQNEAAGCSFESLSGNGLGSGNGGPVVLLSAHLDTVFPASTPLEPVVKGDRIEAPGACDNGAGVVGMLGLAHALVQSKMSLPATLVFVGNVGEEGEGDLRGVRYLYRHSRFAHRVAAHIVLDGAGNETAVTQALGSRRYQVSISGPGGHSFTDAGTVNPIITLGLALANLAQTAVSLDGDGPRTTLNVGTMQGGTSVNTVPEFATAAVDFRSTDVEQLVRLEVSLHRAVEDAVEVTNRAAEAMDKLRDTAKPLNRLNFVIDKIGDRPAAELPADTSLLETLRAVDRHLGLRTDLRLGSTDANLPLSLGIQAVSLGAGGDGGGAHTRGEWYSAANRELGLRRILLLMLAMLEWAANSAE